MWATHYISHESSVSLYETQVAISKLPLMADRKSCTGRKVHILNCKYLWLFYLGFLTLLLHSFLKQRSQRILSPTSWA